MASRKSKSNARFAKLLQPVLDAIASLGGSARPSEVKEWIIRELKPPVEYLNEVNVGGESRFGNDVDWARFYLARSGFLDSSKRGVWSLTELARAAKVDDQKISAMVRAERTLEAELPEAPAGPGSSPVVSYVDAALNRIKALPPAGFENLCQRLLRESGFEEVDVTGRSGDGGIDGQGILKLNSFVSFRILFQCKRYKESVGPAVVRDFRGAMAGRADKGLILTTGYFTQQAVSEASRDGAQPIELVDGENLIKLLAALELGLKPITTYEIDDSFFRQFDAVTVSVEKILST